jgi:hypothetical protein
MRRIAMAGVLLLGAALSVGCSADSTGENFDAVLSGNNEVPVRATAAAGRAQIQIVGDVVHYSVEVENINNLSLSHIHVAPAGSNGPVRVNLYLSPTVSITGKTVLAQGSFDSSDVIAISYAELLTQIRAGNTYVNVHSTTFPGGEIRGQLRPAN